MAVFDDPWVEDALDWDILRNGPIALYFRRVTLEEDVAWFRGRGYEVFSFDCSQWSDEAAFHKAAATTLRFPEYYGRNLDAFNDCLGDLKIENQGGALIVMSRFDFFAHREPVVAQAILDILASASRIFSLLGLRLVAFIQSDDPNIRFEPVGACTVMWNPKEWLTDRRVP